MAIRSELTLRIPNSPGAVADVCRILYDERVNIIGLCLEASGTLRLVVDNHVHAAETLRERHHTVQVADVLYVQAPNSPGALGTVTRMLAQAGVNIDYAYATAIEGGAMAGIVVGVADVERASHLAGV
jgi:hypothetical protein